VSKRPVQFFGKNFGKKFNALQCIPVLPCTRDPLFIKQKVLGQRISYTRENTAIIIIRESVWCFFGIRKYFNFRHCWWWGSSQEILNSKSFISILKRRRESQSPEKHNQLFVSFTTFGSAKDKVLLKNKFYFFICQFSISWVIELEQDRSFPGIYEIVIFKCLNNPKLCTHRNQKFFWNTNLSSRKLLTKSFSGVVRV